MASCPKCGNQLDADARFCGNCGTQLSASGSAISGDEATLYAPVSHVEQLVGRVLNGRYRVGHKLGEGGFGAVFEGTHLQMGRPVAIKVLNPSLTRDPKMVARFRREAQAACNLRDPHTVTTYDFDQSEEGVLYIVMELIRGRSMLAEIQQRGALAPDRALALFDQVCSALMEAHEREIVHRDIKPENILIEDRPSQPDFIKVVDFGIAKIVHDPGGDSIARLTAAGQIFGTLEYMSPEQLAGGLDVDHRADIYALGTMLYQMVTGAPPFSGTPTQLIAAHLNQAPEAPSTRRAEISGELDQIILKCMAKDPAQRFPDVKTLRAALVALRTSGATPQTLAPAPGPATGPTVYGQDGAQQATGPGTPVVVPPTVAPAAALPVTAPPATAPPATAPPAAAPPATAVTPQTPRPAAGSRGPAGGPVTHQVRPPGLPLWVWLTIGGLVLGGFLVAGILIYIAMEKANDKKSTVAGPVKLSKPTPVKLDWSPRGQLARLASSDAELALVLRPSALMTLPGAQALWHGQMKQQVREVVQQLQIGPESMEEALIVLQRFKDDDNEEPLIAVRGCNADASLRNFRKMESPTEQSLLGHTVHRFKEFSVVKLDDRTLAGGPHHLVRQALEIAPKPGEDGARELTMLLGKTDALAVMHMVIPPRKRATMGRKLKLPPGAALQRILMNLRFRKPRLLLAATLFTDSQETAKKLTRFLGATREQMLASRFTPPMARALLARTTNRRQGDRVFIELSGRLGEMVRAIQTLQSPKRLQSPQRLKPRPNPRLERLRRRLSNELKGKYGDPEKGGR